MKKLKFTNIFSLCLMVFGLFAVQTANAQAPVGEAQIEVEYTGGSFNGENSWLLWDATAGAEVLCDDAASVPGVYTANVTQGNTIELYAWETFGDNWNGATIEVRYNEDGSVNACAANMDVILAADGNPGGADGNGSLNACPGGTPADGGGGALATSFVVALDLCPGGATGCELFCPTPVIVATTDAGSDCTALVTVPQPLNNSDCDLSTLTNNYNGTADASDTYPLGTTTVIFSIVDAATGGLTTCSVDVIVQDNTAPVFTCPGDMTINLDAGECEAFLDFNIVANDECNEQSFSLNQNIGVDELCADGTFGPSIVCSLFATDFIEYGRLFDLEALGLTSDFVVQSFDVGYVSTNGAPIEVEVYTLPYGIAIPTEALLGAPIYTETISPALSGAFICGNFDLASDVTIPAGQNLFFSVGAASNGFGGTLFSFDGAGEDAPSYVNGCAVSIPGLFADWTDVNLFFTQGLNLQVNGGVFSSEVPTTADAGNPFANGDALPIGGPYEFTYTASDQAGNVSTCTFEVTIQEYPNPSGSLTCNPQSGQVSLDVNCEAIVGADDVLEGGPYGCYDDYTVELFFDEDMTQPVPTSPLLTSQNVGQTIIVSVTDPETGNSCWSSVIVEDKVIPALECENAEISCTDPTTPGTVIPAGTASETITEGGSWASTADLDNTFAITGPGSVTDVNISLDITHTWVGDLDVTVTSPDGTSVDVLFSSCGNTDDVNVTFDDESANPFACGAGIPVLAGDMQPQNALSAFDGETAGGDWIVTVADPVGGDGGNINSITLTVGYSGASVSFPLPAGAFISQPDINNGQPYTVIGFDPCGPAILTFVDNDTDGDCVNDDFVKIITRTWTIVDQSGNEATCDQEITILRSTVADVVFPLNRDGIEADHIACDDLDDDNLLDIVHPLLNLPNQPDANVLLDDEGHPHPSVTGYPMINGSPINDASSCELNLDYEDQVIDVCEGTYKIIRTWTVLGWCPTTEIVTDVQIIKVVDDKAPVLGEPTNPNDANSFTCSIYDFTISTGQNDCTASAILVDPYVWDACSSYTRDVSVSNGTLNAAKTAVFGLPMGQTTVTYTYTDDCDNVGTCTYIITVADQVNPVAICESFRVVGLTVDEPTLAPAFVFDDGSYDNCGDVTYEVRRMDNPNCPGFDGTPFGDFVPFYCCDVGGPNVMVELRVRDAAGNTNSCMVEVEVQDKLNPAIACPPNKILDCWDDPTDLALTGEATATDNCSAVVTYFDNGDVDNCGVGTIFRIWTATDPGGRTASCVQRIDVINSTPYCISDFNPWTFQNSYNPECIDIVDNGAFNDGHTTNDGVEWPADIDLSTCGPGLLPEDLENTPGVNINNVRPRIFEDACDLVGFTYDDIELPITAPACVKVLRTWKVYDWCTFDEDNFDPNNPTASEGYWEYTQVIKVLNSEAPVITSDCNNVSFCSYDPNCAIGAATLLIDATDDCTAAADLNYEYKIDAFNDGGNDIIGQGADASGNYPIGTHKITWFVEDGCGNVAVCDYLFVIADCKAPTPNLLNGIATDMMPGCMIEIWATDWDNPSSPSFDNCGIEEWRVVSPSQGPGQTAPPANAAFNWTFSGPGDLGTQTVDVWIKDVNGNWGYVSTYILVQDNMNNCNGAPTVLIAGTLENEETEMVDESMLAITGNAPGVPDIDYDMMGDGGEYAFPGLATGGNYVVTPEKDINPLNGVSTFDLVKISQHILEVESLSSPYKIISADINNDGNVTTFDLIQLRRLILFIDTEFQNNTSWRFVEADFVFPNLENPFQTNFPEVFSVNGLTADENNANFIAMKIGDVNCSASPNGLVGESDSRSVGEMVLSVQDAQMKAGETYTVDFTAKDFANIYGYQFTLGFDNSVVEFEGIEAGELTNLSDLNFGMSMINEGIITTSWNNSNAVTMDENAVLFSVTFSANSNANLSDVINVNSRYTTAEAYDNEGVLDINVEFNSENGVTAAAGVFELYQNTPNPFKDETNISFNLPEAGFATLTVYDVSGKVLRVVEGEFAQGYNEVTVNRSEVAGTGVLYYQLDTENNSATKKMIIIK